MDYKKELYFLSSINRLLTLQKDEKEIIKRFSEQILKYGFKGFSVHREYSNGIKKYLFYCGKIADLFKKENVFSSDLKKPKGKGTGYIIRNCERAVFKNRKMRPVHLAVFPFKQNADMYYFLTFYSNDLRMFGARKLRIIREISHDLIYALNNIVTEKNHAEMINKSAYGFASHKMLFDDNGKGIDYIFLEVNPAFERITSLKSADIIGKRVTEVLPGIEKTDFIKTYAEVVATGQAKNFEMYSPQLKRHFNVCAYKIQDDNFVTLFQDITQNKENEEKLRESEDYYRNMFYKHSAIKWLVCPETGQIVDANESAIKFYGYGRDRLLRMKVSDINIMGDKVNDELSKVLRGEQNYFNFIHRLADGSLRHMRVYSAHIRFKNRQLLYSVMQDVTSEFKAEEKNKILFKMLDSSLNEIYVFRERDLKFEYVNSGALKNLGYQKEEIYKMTPLDIKQDISHEKFNEMLNYLKEKQYEKKVFFTTHIRKDGSKYPAEIHLQYYRENMEGFFLAFVEDITERRKYEEKIETLNALYLTLSQANQAMVRAKSEEELFEEIPKVMVKYGGFKTVWFGKLSKGNSVEPVSVFPEGSLYVKSIKIVADPTLQEGRSPTGRAFAHGEIFVENDWYSVMPESFREISIRNNIASICSIPIRKEGKIYRNLTVYSDIKGYFTKERVDLLKELGGDIEYAISKISSDESLARSEAKYRSIFENISLGACYDHVIYDENNNPVDYVILDVNKAYEKLMGMKREDVIGKRSCQVYEEMPFKDIFFNVVKTKKPALFDVYFRPLNKYLSFFVVSPEEGKFSTLFQDITESREYQNDLEKLKTAIDTSADSIVITDKTGKIEYANPAFEKITGYSINEILGQNPRILKSGKHDPVFYQNFYKTINSGKTWRGTFCNRKKDGTLFYEESVVSCVFDSKMEIKNFIAVKRDITEKLKKDQMLLQSQKMEAIGLLSGGIAHDFNNLLTAIMSYAQVSIDAIQKGQKPVEDIREIIHMSERGAALTKQLLTFAKKGLVSPEIFEVNSAIRSLNAMLRRVVRENIELTIIPCPNECYVDMDRSQFEQVIMNMVLNARDAIDSEGKIEIRTFSEDQTTGNEDRKVCIQISDNGKGIKEEHKKHIFEPFFTTKDKSGGTGLGLATVYSIMEQNGGSITFESQYGKGTTFLLLFPAADRYDSRQNKTTAPDVSLADKTVLLVEDEESLLRLAERILRTEGCRVISAKNASDAFEKIRELTEPIDVLVTDIIMPGMNGKELSDRLLAEGKIKTVLFMSGYTDEVINRHGVLEDGINFIHKPFKIEELILKVKSVIKLES